MAARDIKKKKQGAQGRKKDCIFIGAWVPAEWATALDEMVVRETTDRSQCSSNVKCYEGCSQAKQYAVNEPEIPRSAISSASIRVHILVARGIPQELGRMSFGRRVAGGAPSSEAPDSQHQMFRGLPKTERHPPPF